MFKNMFKKLSLYLLSIFLLTGIFTLPAGAKIRFGILPDDTALPFLVAREEGFFGAAGYDIELVNFTNALERDSALQAGVIDGTISDVLAAVFAVSNGHKIKITSHINNRFLLLSSGKMEASGVKDLRGKPVAMSRNTIIEYITDRLLTEHGVDSEEINRVAIPKIPVRLQMLNAGQVAAATLPEPLATLAHKKGAKVLATSDELAGGVPVVILFNEGAINEKTDEIKAFYRAYRQAVERINSNPEAYRSLLVEKGGFPARVRDVFKFPHYHKPALPTREMVDGVMEWMEEKGLLKDKVKYQDLVTDFFVKNTSVH
ncbi:ABC transporter substrate-binding protein [Halothermothrix orenii]|uniref:NLPA lipoprotein n=1 Tax=Halothermothrix orenii (strain H 168 / OCM 544 / DSM 9562) TaxID=373903 RepID=B8CY57_HALOH|nr:MetQ/NlpA family ABC transporter substrate-binding protein [Halothermothrix orenii]ACL70226.1 NLPA lipoprotein [Halothermothrix orenii H 168]